MLAFGQGVIIGQRERHNLKQIEQKQISRFVIYLSHNGLHLSSINFIIGQSKFSVHNQKLCGGFTHSLLTLSRASVLGASASRALNQ